MEFTSKNPWIGRQFANLLFAALTGNTAITLTAVTMNLFKSSTNQPSPDWVPSMATPVDFSGYVPQVIPVPPLPFNLPALNQMGLLFQAMFIANGPVTPPGESAIGYWLEATVGTGGTFMICVETFPTPINFLNSGDAAIVGAVLPFALRPITGF